MDYKQKLIPTKDLTKYARNSRTHSKEQIQQIEKSIKEFGFTNPIIIDENNMIVAGHGRITAAENLKIDKVPCVIVTGWTEAQKKAYVIADNKLALNAGWDEQILSLEMAELQEIGFDLSFTGFDASEFSEVIPLEDLPDLQSGEKSPFQQITFTLHDRQADIIRQAMAIAKNFECSTGELNQNGNGNAIFVICERFIKQNVNS